MIAHLTAMAFAALAIATVFAVLYRDDRRAQLVFGGRIFGALVGGALLVGALQYVFFG